MATGQRSGGVLADVLTEALAARETDEWEDAALYTPYLNDQALLYEYADCLAVQTLLRMLKLPYVVRQRPNAEFISPSGVVPVLRMKKALIAEFQPIVEFIDKKGVQLSDSLTDSERADMFAHMALVQHTLRTVEMFVVWLHSSTYSEVTRKRYGSVYHWPLSSFLPFMRKRAVSAQLQSLQWTDKTLLEHLEQADSAMKALSLKLGDKPYFMGDKPTELDALAFGHIFTIITTRMPCMELANLLQKYENLVEYVGRIERDYFKQ